jgi:hypothetical protein
MEQQPSVGRSLSKRSERGSDGGASYDVSARVGEDGQWHPGDMEITLEPEFYTAAFVSPLHLHQQRHGYERVCGEAFFTLGMLAVATMQCLTVFGMSSYLTEKDMGWLDEFKLGTGLFTTGGSTLTPEHSHDLCGSFSHIGLNSIAGVDHVRMEDGTTFAGNELMPMFHSYKMPSGSWIFHSIGRDESYIDKQLRVVHGANLHDSFHYFKNFRVEYGVLLVIMVGWLWYHVLFEFRKILKFSFVLNHFFRKGFVNNSKDTTSLDPNTGSIAVISLTRNAFAVGYLCVIMRVTVVIMMMIWGTSLLCASWNKLALVLNSLAIGIVFELDVIIAYAVIDHDTMQRIEHLEPVRTTSDVPWSSWHNLFNVCTSVVMLVGVFMGALLIRYWQVDVHMHELQNAASLCLFAGPTPQGKPNVLAPVPGFCESLLSMTCAPNVTGPGSHHGPCLITDQNIFQDKTIMLYADREGFQDMYDSKGKRKSMADWGPPKEKLFDTVWQEDEQLNLFRKICMQLYQPEGKVDKRVIDPNTGLTMYSAPFYCPREKLFKSVFGDVKKDFNKWSATLDLNSNSIVAALDGCHEPVQLSDSVAAPAPAAAPAPSHAFPSDPADKEKAPDGITPATSSTNLLRANRHRAHREIYRHTVHRSG